MAKHKPTTKPGIYFITFTCFDWIPLIEKTTGYDLVYKWFDILASMGHTLTGYVIMPNHLHMLLYYLGGNSSLNKVVGNGKRFMAYEIVDRLEKQKEHPLLLRLQNAVKPCDKRRGKKHEIWENSFDVKHCFGENFLLQKLNYLHNNPCSGKWKLVADPVDYIHSSAKYYATWEQGIYPVRDYREFLYPDSYLNNLLIT